MTTMKGNIIFHDTGFHLPLLFFKKLTNILSLQLTRKFCLSNLRGPKTSAILSSLEMM